MRKLLVHLPLILERSLPWLVLGLLLLFVYAYFFAVPYAGFWYSSSGQVSQLFVTPAPPSDLRLNDQLIQVGPALWSDFRRDFNLTLFEGARPGDEIPLLVERDGQQSTIRWVFPGPTIGEALERVNGDWFLSFFFWLAGTSVMLNVRPKDVRWRLLVAFYYLTALGVITGTGAAQAHVWKSAIVLQTAVWLCVPVYWHLHWAIPQPLRPLPQSLGLVYGAFGLLALAPWFGLVPPRSYVYGLLLAVVGTVVLLLLHFLLQPARRRDITLLLVFAVLAVAPLAVISLARLTGLALPFYAGGASLLALPLLPVGYFYATYRHQLGGMELRRNRLLSLYLFLIVLGTALFILHALAAVLPGFSANELLISVIASILAALVAIVGYAPFQRFVEHSLLGVPPAPTHLLETYASRIATRLDLPGLTDLLKDILAGLLVRQSALVRLDDASRMSVLYRAGIGDGEFPTGQDLPMLLAGAGQYPCPQPQPCAWVRLALPLRLGNQIIGLWLLGRRDPDDEYARPEITVLQALADQTAIALAHIVQSDLLRVAYKADIDRMEVERTSLARELHDDVLGDLAELKGNAGTYSSSPDFLESYDRVTASVRQIVTGLRPAMLNYGLWAALNTLIDALADRAPQGPLVEFDVPETRVRYDADLEQHLYRIVQQACENALHHARASRLTIHGRLEQDHIDLTVQDDGTGFEAGERLDLAGLIAHQHFGLAGMYERATLIQAKLLIDSGFQRGTRIRITWSPHPP